MSEKLNLLRTPMDAPVEVEPRGLALTEDEVAIYKANETFADKLKAANAAILELLARIDLLEGANDLLREEVGPLTKAVENWRDSYSRAVRERSHYQDLLRDSRAEVARLTETAKNLDALLAEREYVAHYAKETPDA